jgi:hypothetical protein
MIGNWIPLTLIQWLTEYPGVEIVCRDPSQTYAEAIDRGISRAIHVANGLHLEKNVSDVGFKFLQQHSTIIQQHFDRGS